jgi:hypothetical protein
VPEPHELGSRPKDASEDTPSYGSSKPLFIRAVELLGQMDIDGRKVEKTPDYISTPSKVGKVWKNEKRNTKRNIPLRVPRTDNRKIQRPHKDRHRRVKEEEEKVENAVVTDQLSKRIRIRDQPSIFSAEQEPIIDAIQKLSTMGVRGAIFTDSLSTMMTASGNNHTKNPKTRKINQRKGNALEKSISNEEEYSPEDLSGWCKV